jgi:hypothetical protein
MKQLIITVILCFFSFSVTAVDINKACNERNEQKQALLGHDMSTSINEAFLAGQCTGYEKTYYSNTNIYSFAKLSQACSEFVEQKKAILPMDMSTTLSEAMQSGMCVGAIYKIAKSCHHEHYSINYTYIANYVRHSSSRQAVYDIAEYVGCR